MKKIVSLLLITITFLLGTNNVFALDVKQESLKVEDKSNTIKVIDEGLGKLQITPKLEFNVVGDFITYKLVLKNNDGKKYKIESITDNNTNDHIKVIYDYNKDLNIDNKTILITFKYDKKINNTTMQLKSIKITIKLIDEDNNTGNINLGGNSNIIAFRRTENLSKIPKTIDNIKNHIWWLFISLIGLILSIYYLVKNKGKKYSKRMLSVLLLLTLIPTIVSANETINIIFNINFENTIINLKHVVSFDTKGAGEIKSQIIDDNEKATTPTKPTKEHYNFVKWLDEENAEFDFNTKVTKDIKLSALWEKKEYTISYGTDGGTNISSQKVKYNETFDEPSKPTRNHYVFKKWVDENNNEYDFSTKATRNITLTAVWDKEEYTIIFNTDGGTPKPEDQKVLYKDKVTKPSNPEKNKHDFDGWLDEQGNLYDFDSEVSKNMVLTAKWTELFTVTYEPNNGSTIPSETVRKNGKFKEPQKPTKEHYNFERWYIDVTLSIPYNFNDEVTSDKKLYAKYTPIEYTIKYNLNGGSVTTANKDKYTIETDNFTLNNPTKNKAVFKGWKKNNETTVNENVTITKGTTGNLEFEAVFNPIHTVTYDVNGGNAITPNTFEKENEKEIGTLQTPSKDHYDFKGWYIGEDKIEDDYIVRSDITLKAKWEKKKYKVTFDTDGGTEIDSQMVPYNEKINLATNPNKKNYRFVKWVDEENQDFDLDTLITKNMTLKAVWVRLYTVTFNPVRGETSEQTRIVEDGKQIGSLPTPTKEGHDFNGWWTAETGGTRIYASQTITTDVTYYARWSPKAYRVYLNTNAESNHLKDYAVFKYAENSVDKGKNGVVLYYRYSEADKKYIFVPSYTYIDEEDSEITTADSYIEPFHCMADFVKWVDKDGNEYTDDSLFHTFEKTKSLMAVWDIHDQYIASPGNFAQAIKNIYNDSTKNMLADDDPNGDLRYIGLCVNNYVSFNDKKWKIIGVFDVDDGNGNVESRVKLVFNGYMTFSYDSSDSTVNDGEGINQWGPSTYQDGSSYEGSDIMRLLNDNDKYLSYDSDTSNRFNWYSGQNNNMNILYYRRDSLKPEAIELIDNALWYTAAIKSRNISWVNSPLFTAENVYQQERGNGIQEPCSYGNACTDTVNRTTRWVGKVGLMYMSDYAYSSNGGKVGRDVCLSENLFTATNNAPHVAGAIYNDNNACLSRHTWINTSHYNSSTYLMNPVNSSWGASSIAAIGQYGKVDSRWAYLSSAIRPVVYLKTDVVLTGGEGTTENPYTISID